MSLNDIPSSIPYWRELVEDANWSKCVYTFGSPPPFLPYAQFLITLPLVLAASLLQIGGEDNVKEAHTLMEQVPGLTQRIAGKSIPLEVCRTHSAHLYMLISSVS